MTAMLSFLAPWWAAGALAAVGLPLLAHLLSRTRYREVLFPATRFVQRAALETARIERPRHRLLMLLRWLLLILVVLAFMRPRWLPEAAADDPERGVALVLLIDASASMQRTADGATLYSRALRHAADQLDGLDASRDVAAVVLVRRRSQALLPEPTANTAMLADRLSATRATHESADWAGAMAIAQRWVDASGRSTHLVTISDQQGDPPVIPDELVAAGVRARHLPIDAPTGNTALRLVDLRPYPPALGRELAIDAEVAHFGDTPRRVTLTAMLGDQSRQQTLTLAPGGRQRVTLELPVHDASLSVLRLAFSEPDALPADDRAGAVLMPSPGSRVLVVHGADAASRVLAERVQLLVRPGEVDGLTLPAVDRVPAAQAADRLRGADAGSLRTVVLLPGIERASGLDRALKNYLEDGGGVIWLRQVATDEPSDAGALPVLLQTSSSDPPLNTAAASIDFSQPMFERFEGPSRAALSALVWPGVGDSGVSPGGEAHLTAPDGRVILASTRLGRGRLVQFNTDLPPGPGGLLAQPAFVVLFNEACRFASPGSPPPTAPRPGAPMPQPLLQADRVAGPSDSVPSGGALSEPGAYLALDDAGRPVAGVWVELDPAESDPRVGPGWAVAMPGAQDAGAGGGADATAPLRAQPVELWPYLLVGVLLLAACESGLLARFAGGGEVSA